WRTPKVKVTFGVFFMTKISKHTKLKAILEYISGHGSKTEIAKRYGINRTTFRMLLAAYSTHGPDVIFNPPKPTGPFRVELTSWAIRNNASHTEVAAKFGYLGIAQILQWKNIYSKLGPNGLLSIQKGRKPNMPKKKQKNREQPINLTEEENRLAQLEDQVLRLQIENEALKLLASIQQRTDNSQK
ncbi:helix-turn-helix domain-containing protein, partial [Weissella kandleri]|uniref:helix-turn-helix domain-containing protein n=1 Tax=Weissella kandleri TaxID=1616 RepID=UPI00387ED63E